MPRLNLGGIETTDSTLDLIEEELGYGAYEVIDLLAEAAREKLSELRKESQESK